MKKLTLMMLTFLICIGIFFAVDAVVVNAESSTFEMSARSSKKIHYDWGKGCEITISAKGDKGKIHIAVFNPKGKKLISGKDKVQVKTGNNKGRYRLVLENRTNKKIKVVLNNVSKLCHDTAMA